MLYILEQYVFISFLFKVFSERLIIYECFMRKRVVEMVSWALGHEFNFENQNSEAF